MPFKKRLLCSKISMLIAAGLVLTPSGQPAEAQLPQFSCRPNAAGDGWICENTTTGTPIISALSISAPLTVAAQAAIAEPATTVRSELAATPTEPAAAATADIFAALNDAAPAAAGLPNPIAGADDAMDWVPREAMTATQLQALADNCCGAFIDPTLGLVDPTADPAAAATVFRSFGGLQQLNENLITLDGDVVIQQGYRTIQNDTTTSIDSSENVVLLQGDVVFREPGILLRGSSARIDSNTSVNRIEEARYVLHDYGAHGQADAIVYYGESGQVVIENGEFSRCEPDNPFWLLRAENIILDREAARGYARAVSLRVKNVPIFYYPFTLSFALGDERKSGFLAPSTGSTRSGGSDFELPYYLNLAPNYDATISPRLISDRGVLTKAEIRYLASWSMNTLTMSNLPDDKLYDPATADIIGSDSPTTDNRWFIDYAHRGTLGRNWSTFVDYSAVSDNGYFYDLGSSGLNLTSRTHLNRQGRLNYHSEYLRAGVDVRRIEIIDPLVSEASLSTPFDRLPSFYFDTDTYLPGGFRIGLSGEVTSFDRDLNEALLRPGQLENGALVHGERLNLEPALSWSLESPGWFVRADAKYKHTAYQLTDQAANTLDDPDLGIAVYSVDSGLIFEREMARGGGGWRQTLEPRLFYLYSEFEDQSSLPLFDTSEMSFSFNQLFRDDRFSGGDRIADADQVTVALTSRFLDSVGKERARFSVGQIRYFEDRLVSLSNPLQSWPPLYSPVYEKSALAGEFAYSFGVNWQLNADVQWNQDTREVDEGSFQLRYQRDSSHLFNFAYRFRGLVQSRNFRPPAGIDSRIKQTDVSGIWPLSANWKLLARWNYDHSNTRNLEIFAGIEYSNCCVTIRLIGREWVDERELFLPNIEPNRGIFVQFTLNGLGNITGGGLSNLLSDGIWGFREPDYD